MAVTGNQGISIHSPGRHGLKWARTGILERHLFLKVPRYPCPDLPAYTIPLHAPVGFTLQRPFAGLELTFPLSAG